MKHNTEQSQYILSIIIPVYNEAGNIIEITKRIQNTLEPLSISYELILIDDGSADATWQQICKTAQNNPKIKGISLSRNFGHQNALMAGLKCAQGKALITMDGDLQHPPEYIPTILDKWKQGYKIVNTIRASDKNTSIVKRLSSALFYRCFSFLSGIHLHGGISDFRLIDRIVLESFTTFNDATLFIRGIVNWVGFSTTTITYTVEKRFSGSTKYTFRTMMRFAINAITAFSTIPLKIGIWLGVLTSSLSFIELAYMFIAYLYGKTVQGWASIIGIISFLFGILFIILGIIGIYLAQIHECVKHRPRFIIDKTINA